MRIALFGKAVSPDDAEALRLALDRVLAIDPEAWISRAYMAELSDHMNLPAGLVPYEGEVPQGVDVLLAFGGDGTVLEAGTLVRHGAVPILGVNTGRLGFLSNVSMEALTWPWMPTSLAKRGRRSGRFASRGSGRPNPR